MNAPCYKCPDRHDLCHANCERYLEFRAELDKASEERIKANAFTGYDIELCKSRQRHSYDYVRKSNEQYGGKDFR